MTILSSKHYDRSIIPAVLKQAVVKANAVGPTGTNITVPNDADPNMWGPILKQVVGICNGLTGPTGQARPIDANADLSADDSKNSIGDVLKQCVDTLNLH